MKDKTKIWTDCAECAHKHLTAAYAIATQTPPRESTSSEGYGVMIEEAWILLLARAQIAAREAISGYVGNFDLAAGCLAAIEPMLRAELTLADKIRDMRLEIMNKGTAHLLLNERMNPSMFVLAHLREAARELPELWSRDEYKSATNWYWDQRGVDDMTELIAWVRKTYELGVKHADKETTDVPAAG